MYGCLLSRKSTLREWITAGMNHASEDEVAATKVILDASDRPANKRTVLNTHELSFRCPLSIAAMYVLFEDKCVCSVAKKITSSSRYN